MCVCACVWKGRCSIFLLDLWDIDVVSFSKKNNVKQLLRNEKKRKDLRLRSSVHTLLHAKGNAKHVFLFQCFSFQAFVVERTLRKGITLPQHSKIYLAACYRLVTRSAGPKPANDSFFTNDLYNCTQGIFCSEDETLKTAFAMTF